MAGRVWVAARVRSRLCEFSAYLTTLIHKLRYWVCDQTGNVQYMSQERWNHLPSQTVSATTKERESRMLNHHVIRISWFYIYCISLIPTCTFEHLWNQNVPSNQWCLKSLSARQDFGRGWHYLWLSELGHSFSYCRDV